MKGNLREMRSKIGHGFLAVFVSALLIGEAAAQPPQPPGMPTPRLFHVSPRGGQIGSTFEATFTGQDLDDARELLFSVPGIKAERVGSAKPAPADPKQKAMGKPAPPQTSQKFKITLPPKAPLGIHDVRIVNKWGVSNPRAFVIGDLKEHVEKEGNDDLDQAQQVELNCSISGVIGSQTDVDYFRFSGKKGQRVVVSCLSTSLDSRLPAAMQLYGSGDKYLGFNRDYQNSDALLDAVLPADGDYYVRLFSFSYTLGGPDYFYRLTISTAPWIDAVFPQVIEPGKEAQVTFYGRNLPGGKLDPAALADGRPLERASIIVKASDNPLALQRLDTTSFVGPASSVLDGFEHRLKNATGLSNPILFTYARAPVVLDREPNDSPESPQKITVPCEIAGRIDKKADRDCFAFTAKKGEVYSIELIGDRLGSPVNLLFLLRDSAGKTITEQDDNPEILSPQLFTRTEDPPRYRFVVPADGVYQLQVGSGDSYTQFGPRHQYVARIVPEKPDFRLIAMPTGGQNPEAAVVGKGGHQAFNLLVWRLEGFNGDITLTAADLPPGVTAKPQILPAGQKQGAFIVSASPDAAPWAGAIKVQGTAVVNGQKVVREVRAATTTWPVPVPQIPAISRIDRSLVLGVGDKAPFSLTSEVDQVTVKLGERITIPVKLTRLWPDLKGPIQVTPLSLPPSMALQPVTLNAGQDKVKVNIDTKPTVVPGKYTIVLRGQVQTAMATPQKKANVLIVQPSTPVSVIILPKQVAKLSVTPTPAAVKAGKQTELVVKVARLTDYAGAFKVEIELPKDAKGISAKGVDIPAGKDEAKIMLVAAADAPAGPRPNITVRATAMFEGTPIVHEAKVTVNVAK
jgi:hypothetical protein